jgi:Transposase/Transposase IS116/IS110/IS902 family
MDECAAFIGIDWADAKHDICLHVTGSATRELDVLEHRSDTIDAWVSTWRTRFSGQPMAICLELQKGPLVSALRQDDFLGRFPIPPRMLARSREAFTPSQAKADPTDAERLLELLFTHRDTLKPLQPQRPAMRALEPLVEHRRRLVGDNVCLTNRLTSTLQHYLPHGLPWFHAKDTTIFCDVLTPWPTLKAVPLARRSPQERFFHDHHVRDAAVITPRLHAITSATPLTTDDGIITPHALWVQALVAPLRVTLHALEDVDTAIAHRAQRHPDCLFFDALPGAGAVFAPRLLVAFGEPRHRYASADALQRYAGLAPVTERRGNKAWVHWRLQCPKFLRPTFVAWAAESTRHSF